MAPVALISATPSGTCTRVRIVKLKCFQKRKVLTHDPQNTSVRAILHPPAEGSALGGCDSQGCEPERLLQDGHHVHGQPRQLKLEVS